MTRRTSLATILAIGLGILFHSDAVLQASPENVVWTNFVHTSANGNTLIHDSINIDGGATSVQTIGSGNGYVEFTVGPSSANVAAGLSNGNTDATLEDIDFSFRTWLGVASIRHNATYLGETSVVQGDVLRVEIVGSNVVFKKNGSAVLTATNPGITYPVLVDGWIGGPNQTLDNVIIEAGSGGGSGSGISFTNFVHTSANGNSLVHDSINIDGGATSVQTIDSGDGYVEFTVGPSSSNVGAGLSHGNTDATLEDIDFAFRTWLGVATMMHNGTYVGETNVVQGDVVRVEIVGSNVLFKKNGSSVGTLTNPGITYPILVDAWIGGPDQTLNNVVFSGSGGSGGGGEAGLSALYPGDVGIENHPDVVFVERFDESTIGDLLARWSDHAGDPRMSFSIDVPNGGPSGARSLAILGGGVSNGGQMFKKFCNEPVPDPDPSADCDWNSTGPVVRPLTDTLYIRYYIKYAPNHQFAHAGIWMGGQAGANNFPEPHAGEKPNGDDRFIAAAEQGTNFDHYDYWMGMHADGNGSFFGNLLLNDPSKQAGTGWVCVEHMVKLNNPVSSLNGEHAIWFNGVKISHVGLNFPHGHWGDPATGGNPGIFTQNPGDSTTFEGLQWRSTTAIDLNWMWLQNYAPGFDSATVNFAYVVAAKSHIGCLTPQ